jgi:hypothetical protein
MFALWNMQAAMGAELPTGDGMCSDEFEEASAKEEDSDVQVPVQVQVPRPRTFFASSADASHIHRFFDSSPFSPSGRYLAMMRMTEHGSLLTSAKVVVVDLSSMGSDFTSAHAHAHANAGATSPELEWVVDETQAWGSQLGAQVQWGGSDAELVYNVLSAGGRAVGVVQDVFNEERRVLQCSVYHVSSDGFFAVSPDLMDMSHTQLGYGVDTISVHHMSGQGHDPHGLMLADLRRGAKESCRELVSLARVATYLRDEVGHDVWDTLATTLHGFHAKWAPTSGSAGEEYVMFVVRQVGSFPARFFGKAQQTQHQHSPSKVHRVNHLFIVTLHGGAAHTTRVDLRRVKSWSSSLGHWREGEVVGNGNHPNWVIDTDTDTGTHFTTVDMNMNMDTDTDTDTEDTYTDTDTNRVERSALRISMNTRVHGADWTGRAHKWWNLTLFDILTLEEEVVFQRSTGHPVVANSVILLDTSLKERYWFNDDDSDCDDGCDHEDYEPPALRAYDMKTKKMLYTLSTHLGDEYFEDVEYVLDIHHGLSSLWGYIAHFMTHTVPMYVYGVPWRSNAHQRLLAAWRCDAHPAWSRDLTKVAINVRDPVTHVRRVLVVDSTTPQE